MHPRNRQLASRGFWDGKYHVGCWLQELLLIMGCVLRFEVEQSLVFRAKHRAGPSSHCNDRILLEIMPQICYTIIHYVILAYDRI
jgi:hypothetical protein